MAIQARRYVETAHSPLTAARAEAGTLTPAEHAELVRVGDELEDIQARRLEALAELARLRGVTVPALMAKLGIRPGKHA